MPFNAEAKVRLQRLLMRACDNALPSAWSGVHLPGIRRCMAPADSGEFLVIVEQFKVVAGAAQARRELDDGSQW